MASIKSLQTIILLLLTVLLFTGCKSTTPEDPAHPEQGTAETSTEPEETSSVEINIEFGEIIPTFDEEGMETDIPQHILFNVSITNAESLQVEDFGINFIYEAMLPTDEFTYLLEDPTDVNSRYISDEDGPINYMIVEQIPGRIESDYNINDQDLSFAVSAPANTIALRYHAEIVISSEGGETAIIDMPYTTLGKVFEQGGILPLETD